MCVCVCVRTCSTELQRFLPNVPQFGEYAAFSGQKQGLRWCLQDSVLRRGHQSAALLVGERGAHTVMSSSAATAYSY